MTLEQAWERRTGNIDPSRRAEAIVLYITHPDTSQLDAQRHYAHTLTGQLKGWYENPAVAQLAEELLHKEPGYERIKLKDAWEKRTAIGNENSKRKWQKTQ